MCVSDLGLPRIIIEYFGWAKHCRTNVYLFWCTMAAGEFTRMANFFPQCRLLHFLACRRLSQLSCHFARFASSGYARRVLCTAYFWPNIGRTESIHFPYEYLRSFAFVDVNCNRIIKEQTHVINGIFFFSLIEQHSCLRISFWLCLRAFELNE